MSIKDNKHRVTSGTLFSSTSPSLVSPSAFSESESKPAAFSKRSSKESSSNYSQHKFKYNNHGI